MEHFHSIGAVSRGLGATPTRNSPSQRATENDSEKKIKINKNRNAVKSKTRGGDREQVRKINDKVRKQQGAGGPGEVPQKSNI